MTFTRTSSLGFSAVLLLQLIACSANDSARMAQSNAQDERVDSTAVGSGTDPKQADGAAQTGAENSSPCAEPFTLENLKWLNELEKPRVFEPSAGKDEKGNPRDEYTIKVREAQVQMLPKGCPPTRVFAYGGPTRKDDGTDPAETWDSPGATFEMKRGTPARVTWVNEITTPHLFPIDATLHWANPNQVDPPIGPFKDGAALDPKVQSPVAIVTHVHGLEVGSASDGAPEAWFTARGTDGKVLTGPQFVNPYSEYPNSQPPTTLWYHDHALGITRLNVYAGLAGLYVIRDPNDKVDNLPGLPDRAHEMPLVLQDKTFKSDGSLDYPQQASTDHPYWGGYFGGETFVVNGKVWPVMHVERTRYRFRMLNAANYLTFKFSLADQQDPQKVRKFTVIGSDGGYLSAPTEAEIVRLAPGERADVVVDFSDLAPGHFVTLTNGGQDAVRFAVPDAAPAVTARALPTQLNTRMVELETNVDKRTVTLHSAADGGYLLNGQTYHSAVTEQPVVGSTEDWDIVNISGDEHPIHLHLVQFRIMQRRQLKGDGYSEAWKAANGGGTLPLSTAALNPDADNYLVPESEMDETAKDTAKITATESGWKDTISAPAGFVTRIRVRWAPQDAAASTAPGANPFAPLDPTTGPGYVWHCHMLEHEDNDMMRPLKLQNAESSGPQVTSSKSAISN